MRGIRKVCSTMGWEQRGTYSFYYRKEREGSRVRSVYIGRGEMAAAISHLDRMQREEAEAEHDRQQPEFTKLSRLDSEIESLRRLIVTVTDATLISAGFHTHKRQWRKMRNGNINKTVSSETTERC